MGKASIISHIADGQYTAEILYDETQMQAQIDAVVQALTLVGEQITEAAASIVTLESQLAQQKETLRLRVLAWRTLLDEQPALEDAVEARADELETLEEELQSLKDAGAEQFYIDSKQAEVDAKTDELQQANTDLATNESDISTIRTEIDGLYDTTAKTKAQLDMAKTKHGNLILRQAALDARLLALDANNPPEDIRDIWCADLTEDLTGEWPTIDIPGESELILLAPEEYVDEHNLHATTTSQFAPVVAMSPAQAAFNFAIHPGWQRHKPTYRVGVITAIDTTEDTASVTLDAANSRYQNLNVNEATFLADIDVVYMSCNASAFEVDDRVVVEFPYQIPSEQHLQQTISNLAAAHSAALAFKTDLEARLAEVEAEKTAAEAVRDSLSAQLSAQMSADPVDPTAIEITLAQQVVNGALLTRLTQKKIFTDQAISAVTAKIQRIQTAFDDATALAAVYPGPRVIGFETEPQACGFRFRVVRDDGLLLTPDNSGVSFTGGVNADREFGGVIDYDSFTPYDYMREEEGWWHVNFPMAVADPETGDIDTSTGFTSAEMGEGIYVKCGGVEAPGIGVQYPRVYKIQDFYGSSAEKIKMGEYEVFVPYFETESESDPIYDVDITGQINHKIEHWLNTDHPVMRIFGSPQRGLFFRNGAQHEKTVKIKSSIQHDVTSSSSGSGGHGWFIYDLACDLYVELYFDGWDWECEKEPGAIRIHGNGEKFISSGHYCESYTIAEVNAWRSVNTKFRIQSQTGGSVVDWLGMSVGLHENSSESVKTSHGPTFNAATKPLQTPMSPAQSQYSVTAINQSNADFEAPGCCEAQENLQDPDVDDSPIIDEYNRSVVCSTLYMNYSITASY